MKNITIISSVTSSARASVLATAAFMIIGLGGKSHAGVFEQLAAVANSALPAYGREQALHFRPDLAKQQIESGIKEALFVASDRVVEQVVADSSYSRNGETQLSSDMRRAKKTALKLGHESSFEQLQLQVNEAVVALAPTTGELLKGALARVELAEPRRLLASHDTAATDFLRHKVSTSLQRQLQPLVLEILERTGAAASTASLASKIQFGNLLDTIVTNHIIEQSIDGFFDQLEVQETSIRHNPSSRTTKLLRRVFG